MKRPGGPRHQRPGLFTAGIGVDAALANYHQRLAVQGVFQADRIFPVGQVDYVVHDAETVGQVKGPNAPGIEVVALGVKDDNGRVLALVNIDPSLGIAGYRAYHAESPTLRQPRPVLHQVIVVLLGVNQGHVGTS